MVDRQDFGARGLDWYVRAARAFARNWELEPGPAYQLPDIREH